MSTETNNHFFYNYQMAKHAYSINDGHFDGLLSSPLNPVKVVPKKIKSVCRMLTKKELRENDKLLKSLNIKL